MTAAGNAPPKTAPFAVMTKPVGSLCNMRCSYCYYIETGTAAPPMEDAVLEAFVRQYIEAHPGPVVPFTWHGGEPTLAGLDFYRRAVALQQKHLPEGMSCWNNLQTNGLLLDEQWCAFLAEHSFDVGLSIDGAEQVHDAYRRDERGGPTHARIAENILRLKAHGVRPDLLCTVSSGAAAEPLAVYRALRDFDTGWVQFIPIVVPDGSGGVTSESVSAEGYGEFLCEIFDEWLHHDLGRLDVQLFAEAALVQAGGEASLCWMAPLCGRVLVVERDGGVYSCDHFVNAEHRIGSLQEGHLAALVDLPEQRSFGEAKAALPDQCLACRWLSLCNGGCPKDRFLLSEDGQPGLNFLCAGYRRFFSHAAPQLQQLMALRRQGQSPAAMLAHFRAQQHARWKGIGRNDPCPCGSGKKTKHCCWEKRP